jgi:hypothetical protein
VIAAGRRPLASGMRRRDRLRGHQQEGQHSAVTSMGTGPGTECPRRGAQYRATDRSRTAATGYRRGLREPSPALPDAPFRGLASSSKFMKWPRSQPRTYSSTSEFPIRRLPKDTTAATIAWTSISDRPFVRFSNKCPSTACCTVHVSDWSAQVNATASNVTAI